MNARRKPGEGRALATTAAALDAAAGRRVLVFGSLPPYGRDLDLLVRPQERVRLEERLRADGFLRKGSTWARFSGGAVEAVDLVDVAEWGLPEMEAVRLFADAQPLDGLGNVVRPAPHHELLVLARLSAGARSLSERRRERLRDAASRSGAWSRAAELAPAWRLERELEHLRKLARSPAARAPRRLPRPRRPCVVALSGIDGAGKTTQAELLCGTLERLGYEAVVAWTPLSMNASVDAVGRLAKRLLGAVYRPQPVPPGRETALEPTIGTAVRERSRAAELAWTLLVAGANGLFNARAAVRHGLSGRVVVFDRYVLDSAARLRFQYGEDRRFRAQNALVRALAPRPVASFWLDVPADAAHARKSDWWTLPDLRLQERLYREEAGRLDVVRLDGERAPSDLAAEIAATVWQRLR